MIKLPKFFAGYYGLIFLVAFYDKIKKYYMLNFRYFFFSVMVYFYKLDFVINRFENNDQVIKM